MCMDSNDLKHVFVEDGKIVRTVPFTEQEVQEYHARCKQSVARVIKEHRDALLEQSDILVLPDRWESYSPEKRFAIANYRQALRDVPAKYAHAITFEQVVWPELNS